jgi:hypothetical protein
MKECEDFSKLATIQKCPLCGEELNRGYVVPGGITWDDKKHKWDVDLSKRLVPRFTFTILNLPALRCKKCKLLIFNYIREPKE